MAISHLVVSLAKWTEFYRHYRTILPADAHDACLALHHQIIAAALSTSATQLSVIYWIMIQSGPLTSREIDERLERVIAGNREDFLRGINNTTANIFPHTVVAITEHVRDRLGQEYDLRDEEIV
jgi:hypothetical protein